MQAKDVIKDRATMPQFKLSFARLSIPCLNAHTDTIPRDVDAVPNETMIGQCRLPQHNRWLENLVHGASGL